MVMETAVKLNYFPTNGGCSNYFSPREILHHDNDSCLGGVQGDNTSLAGVPIPITTNGDNDNSDAESNHNSIDPNKADDNSSKASVHSTGSQVPVHSMTSEPPQQPPDEEEPDNIQLSELETQVPILC